MVIIFIHQTIFKSIMSEEFNTTLALKSAFEGIVEQHPFAPTANSKVAYLKWSVIVIHWCDRSLNQIPFPITSVSLLEVCLSTLNQIKLLYTFNKKKKKKSHSHSPTFNNLKPLVKSRNCIK
ncbi:hypothetical protein HanPI659440_Chr17g0698301 [Helianthus annuus]|nr:hypothetical protein HanPI659440_Chr17g0698301 [Helianthus annuus]